MDTTTALRNDRSGISRRFNLPDGQTLEFKLEHTRVGVCIDTHDVGVYVNGQRTGIIYIHDAVTFRSWCYRGKDPLDCTQELRVEGNLPFERNPATVTERMVTRYERMGQRGLLKDSLPK